jgi:hypothetical protein
MVGTIYTRVMTQVCGYVHKSTPQAKSPTIHIEGLLLPPCGGRYKKLGSDLLSHAKSILSLALVRFTALFEMGRGGSKPLWPPSITGNSCALLDFHLIAYHKQKCCALHSIFIELAS